MRARLGPAAAIAIGVAVAGCEVRAAGGAEALPPPQDRPLKEVLRPGSDLFSRVIRAGDLLFVSGTLGTRAEEDGVGPETRMALETIRADLEAVGSSMEAVVKCTVFLADLADYRAMNDVYREFFPAEPPTRSAVQAGLVADARVEIECFAVAPEADGM